MLSEEALVLLATLVAFGLLILGIWEEISPSRRRRPARPVEVISEPSGDREARISARLDAAVAREPGAPPADSARALRSVDDAETAAAESARSGEVQGGALAEDAVRRGGQAEVDRRLWRSYTNLGLRQIEERRFEEALDPLYHALRMNVGSDRLVETRGALVRAYEGIVVDRCEDVRRLVEAGQPSRAEAETERLWAMLRDGIDQGVPQDDLAELLRRVQGLFEDIGRESA